MNKELNMKINISIKKLLKFEKILNCVWPNNIKILPVPTTI